MSFPMNDGGMEHCRKISERIRSHRKLINVELYIYKENEIVKIRIEFKHWLIPVRLPVSLVLRHCRCSQPFAKLA